MNRSSLISRIVLLLLVGWAPLVAQSQDGQRRYLPKPLEDVFGEVIREARRSTVQVYCDGYRAALGAIVRSDGHIVTKASELKGKIECQFAHEAKKYPAEIVARDPATDLAVLKVTAERLPVVPWSDSESPPVGSWLATPALTQKPLSFGVVSVAARKISPPQAALGIQLDQSDDVARVATVVPGLAAAKAGIRDGDIIRKVNDEEIRGLRHLQQTIKAHQPGDRVSIVYERDGRLQTIEVTLSNMSELVHDERSEFQNNLGGALSERRTGFPLAIQHDSVLRPGDCGGPIVDVEGKAVGINIARAGRVESYALPASLVRETVDRLLATELTSATAVSQPAPSTRPGQER